MVEARKLIAAVTGTFDEFEVDSPPLAPDGPLNWTGYLQAHAAARERTGETESVVCGHATIGDIETAIIAFDFGFLGGSIGRMAGDRIVNAIHEAALSSIPVVSMI